MRRNDKVTFGIFGNTDKEDVKKLLSEIVNYLISKKIEFLVDESLIKFSSGNLGRHSSARKKISLLKKSR